MKQSKAGSIKRILTLQMSMIGLFIHTGLYALIWFNDYYPLVRLKLKFYINGHILIMLIYFLLLMFITRAYEGNKVGFLKHFDVILSQVFSLFIVNVISYFQISLMRNWMVPQGPMWRLLLIQIAFSIAWVYLSDYVYRKVSRRVK